MRPPTALRLLAALLAFCAALSSPVLALAHGEAHEHERRPAAHVLLGATDSTASTAVSTVTDAADDAAPHPGLHAGCLAKIASSITLALRSAPAVAPVLAASTDVGEGTPPADDCTLAAIRAAPPDHPRAPPVLWAGDPVGRPLGRAASLIAGVLDFANVNAVSALYWMAVINGVLAPFLLVGILLAASDHNLMHGQPSPRLGRIIVGVTAAVMFAAAIGMFAF